LPANTRNRAFWETEYKFITLAFKPNILIRYVAETIDVNNIELLPTLSHPDPLVHGIALALKSELESNQLGGRVYVDSLVTALMAHLLRNYSVKKFTQPLCKNGLPKRKLQQVQDYIHAHIDEDLTLFKLAAIVYMSPSYFSTLFKHSKYLLEELKYQIGR
jgi:AraC family transcriptional regulator